MTFETQRPIVVHIITSLEDGGAEAVLYRLIRTATEFEHQVISLQGPGKYGPIMEKEGFKVYYLSLRSSLPSPFKLMRLVEMVRFARPDVVQTWMYHADLLGGYAAWHAGVRNIVWGLHHTTLDAQHTKWSTRQLLHINRRVSTWLPRSIITCSEKGGAIHRKIGFPEEKMVVVHNGYDTSTFQPDEQARNAIRAEIGIAKDKLLLGCVARYDPQKDHHNLILGYRQVVEKRQDTHLLLIGSRLTEKNTKINGLIADLGLSEQVTLLGSRTDIPALMNGIDIHVLASAFGEAFPNVLSEAMACGTPCVATDVGDSAKIVGQTGAIVPPQNPEALAEAILGVALRLRDSSIAEACRARIVENFSVEQMAANYGDVWRNDCHTKVPLQS